LYIIFIHVLFRNRLKISTRYASFRRIKVFSKSFPYFDRNKISVSIYTEQIVSSGTAKDFPDCRPLLEITRIFLTLERMITQAHDVCYLYTCTILRVCALRARTRGRRRTCIAQATAAERGQRVASLVNNAGRGNGAISAHLLLNVRFTVLSPRVSPRAHPAPSFPFPRYQHRPTLCHPLISLNPLPGTVELLPP